MKAWSLLILALLPVVTLADAVDDIVKDELKKQGLPGVSIAVVKDGKLVRSAGYGVSNLETGTAATKDTVYEIGSITKQFTATLVMMLVQEKKLTLDEQITSIFPNLPTEWSGVTIRHLLTHTSGLPDYTDPKAFEFTYLARNDFSFDQVLAQVTKLPMPFKFGEKFSYNNFGYYLLGRIVEKKSGKDYWSFLSERIFKPLGMSKSAPSNPKTIIPNRAHGYLRVGAQMQNADAITSSSGFSAGSIVSTVEDMAKWEIAMGSEKLLPKSAWTQMWTPGTTNDGKRTSYGFGWAISDVNKHRVLMHSGGTVGFVTHSQNFPDDKLSVIVLTNAGSANPGRIAMRISGVYNKALQPEEQKPIADTEPEVAKLLQKAIAQVAAAKLDENMYTKEMFDTLTSILEQISPQIKSLGPVKKVELLSKSKAGDLRTYKYSVTFDQNALTFNLTLTKENKIAGLIAQ